MTFGATVPESTVKAITQRAERLAELVDAATKLSPEKRVRASGAQLIELIEEWVEEIRELCAAGDEDAADRLNSFRIRLRLAEAKVKTWPIPKAAKPRARRRAPRKRVRDAA